MGRFDAPFLSSSPLSSLPSRRNENTKAVNRPLHNNSHLQIIESTNRRVTMTSNEEGIAKVTFRVRCDSLGFGESVYLAREDDASRVSCSLT